MAGSRASASSDAARVLVSGLNWIGDSIMAMPALQAFRARNPGAQVTMLVKESFAPLWRMHTVPDRIVTYRDTNRGTLAVARSLREERFDRCFVLPNSFRSAWIPFLARIPRRTGYAGNSRSFLLNEVQAFRPEPGRAHQVFEYMQLLGVADAAPGFPVLAPPAGEAAQAAELAKGRSRPLVGIMPGAARGPAKRWPAAKFAKAADVLLRETGGSAVLFGAGPERPLADEVEAALGGRALNLAGKTGLAAWAAWLGQCDLVLCNDSGGMHLAAAVGAPVAAVFGITDPGKTGPRGRAVRVIQHAVERSRDVARDSEEAARSLESVQPEEVVEAALELLRRPGVDHA